MRLKILSTFLLAGTLFTVTALPAFALNLPQLVPTCATTSGSVGAPPPTPQLDCVLQFGANIANIILALTGSIALLMFVIGGFFMLASGGNEEMVKKGKDWIKNAVIGLIVILLSGMVLSFGISQITNTNTIVGQYCKKGNKSGSYVQVPKNKNLVCVTQCTDLSAEKYTCTDPAAVNGSVYKEYCLPLPGCTSGQVCCYSGP